MDLLNFSAYDAFRDTGEDDTMKSYVHIRVQQRNGRKTLTTVQGLADDLDQKRILKAFKKDFACNGNIVQDEDMGEVIQLQGDHRVKVSAFLISEKIVNKEQVKVHGF